MTLPVRRPVRGRTLLVFSAFASSCALNAGGAEPPTSDGLLRPANVRVVTATPQQVAAEARALRRTESAVRAFVNPDTGELRDPTPEEMLQNSAQVAKAARGQAASLAFSAARGGLIIPLDDSFLSNSVVTRDATGALRMQCVEGATDAAHAVLHRHAAKEARHDR